MSEEEKPESTEPKLTKEVRIKQVRERIRNLRTGTVPRLNLKKPTCRRYGTYTPPALQDPQERRNIKLKRVYSVIYVAMNSVITHPSGVYRHRAR
jgi:hypothetical protein